MVCDTFLVLYYFYLSFICDFLTYRYFNITQQWWGLITFNEFKSHVNFLKELDKLSENNTRVRKDSGNTSATN